MGNKKSSHSNELTEADIRLLENNTGLSRDQIANWYRQFMTDYPDGSIDQKEFIDIFRKTYQQGNAEKYAKLAFYAFDENRNGKISFEEFLLATSFVTNGSGDRSKQLELAFDIFDKDNNGTISKKEMEQAVGAIYDMAGEGHNIGKNRVDEIFKKYDLDQSRSLDRYEFINFITTDPICKQAFNM